MPWGFSQRSLQVGQHDFHHGLFKRIEQEQNRLLRRKNIICAVHAQHVDLPASLPAAAIAGEVDINFPSVTGALPFIANGRLKALAVSSAKRASMLPSVPTLNEVGLTGYERNGWNGVLAPAGVPKDIIARLNAAIVKAVNTPEMKEAFIKQGLEVQTGTPEQFAAFVRDQLAQNAKVVKFAGIKTE